MRKAKSLEFRLEPARDDGPFAQADLLVDRIPVSSARQYFIRHDVTRG